MIENSSGNPTARPTCTTVSMQASAGAIHGFCNPNYLHSALGQVRGIGMLKADAPVSN